MQLSVKDVRSLAEDRFNSKFIRSIWGWLFFGIILICVIFGNVYDKGIKDDQSVIGYRSDSGDTITYSVNYGDIIEQYVFDGNTLANHGEYVTFNDIRYDASGMDKYEIGRSFYSYLYDYRRYIIAILLIAVVAIGYLKYYNPRKKYIKQLLDEYGKEGNK